MSLFMGLIEKPFQEVRCSVFRVMSAMATQAWGQVQFRDHPTFCEFLLNRGTEHSKEEKEDKFRIIITLVESPTILDVMGRVYYVKLKEYVKEGPFYVQAQSTVAMESDTWSVDCIQCLLQMRLICHLIKIGMTSLNYWHYAYQHIFIYNAFASPYVFNPCYAFSHCLCRVGIDNRTWEKQPNKGRITSFGNLLVVNGYFGAVLNYWNVLDQSVNKCTCTHNL